MATLPIPFTTKHSEIKSIFNADSKTLAEQRLEDFIEKWSKPQPKLTAWAEENLLEGFTVFDYPENHRKKLRTSNACETLNSQVKRRKRVFIPSSQLFWLNSLIWLLEL